MLSGDDSLSKCFPVQLEQMYVLIRLVPTANEVAVRQKDILTRRILAWKQLNTTYNSEYQDEKMMFRSYSSVRNIREADKGKSHSVLINCFLFTYFLRYKRAREV
jgi:hypothetical protein